MNQFSECIFAEDTEALNSLEELCMTSVATVNFFAKVLNQYRYDLAWNNPQELTDHKTTTYKPTRISLSSFSYYYLKVFQTSVCWLVFEWQQSFSSLRHSSPYSGRYSWCCTLNGLYLSSDFQVFHSLNHSIGDWTEYTKQIQPTQRIKQEWTTSNRFHVRK